MTGEGKRSPPGQEAGGEQDTMGRCSTQSLPSRPRRVKRCPPRWQPAIVVDAAMRDSDVDYPIAPFEDWYGGVE
jgi:hypothetical protein